MLLKISTVELSQNSNTFILFETSLQRKFELLFFHENIAYYSVMVLSTFLFIFACVQISSPGLHPFTFENIVIIKTSKYRIMFKPIWSNLIKSIVGRWF